jgi:formylmethanofuran dehydrogenase subunit E
MHIEKNAWEKTIEFHGHACPDWQSDSEQL